MQVQKPKQGYKKVEWHFGKNIDIPENWDVVKLENITKKIMKGIFDMSPDNYIDKGIPFLRVSDIEDNSLKLNNSVFISNETSKNFPNSELYPKDIVLAKVGSIYTNNKIAKIPENIPKINISQNMIGIKTNQEVTNPDYLLLELIRNYHIIVSFSNATTLGALRLDILRNLKIPLPTFPEQKKIASILSNVDSLISFYDDIIDQTKQLKKGLMQQLLTKGIGHTKFKKVKWLFGTEIEIPVEWKIEKLEDLADILDSKRIPIEKSEREKRHGKYPYYGASGIIDYIDDYIFDETLLCLAEDGENLRSRALPIAFTIKGKTWVNNHAHVLRAKETTEHYFLEYFLSHLSFLKYVASTAQPKLNQKDMRSIPIISPPKEEQQQIAFILSEIGSRTEIIEQTRTYLQSLKKGLMQKLLTGQIRVKV